MMKKTLCLLLAAFMLFAMASCSEKTSNDKKNDPANAGNAAAEESAAPAYESVSLGGSVTTDFTTITLEEVGCGEEIKFGNTVLPKPDNGDYYIWIKGTLTNNTANALGESGKAYLDKSIISIDFVFDGENKVNASLLTSSPYIIEPSAQNTVHMFTHVPKETLQSFKTLTVHFAFNDQFAANENYEQGLETFSCRYELVYENTMDVDAITGLWATSYYADEFNEPTDEWMISNKENFTGTFSNSAATDAELQVKFVVDDAQFFSDQKGNITIFLYEYGNRLVKNSSSIYTVQYKITMRTGEGVDHSLEGGMLRSGDRIFILPEYMPLVLEEMQKDQTLSFFLRDDNLVTSTYLFSFETSNFAKEYQAKIAG